MVPLKNKFRLAGSIASRVIGGLILFGCIAVARAQAADSGPQPQFVGLAAGLPQDSLTLISLTPLIANGQTVGGIATIRRRREQRTISKCSIAEALPSLSHGSIDSGSRG